MTNKISINLFPFIFIQNITQLLLEKCLLAQLFEIDNLLNGDKWKD